MSEPLRALLVEDCEADAILLLRALGRAGFIVDWQRAESAAQFDALLALGGWEVIIADYTLPQFGAMAALIRVQERSLEVPFIIVSGVVGEEAAVEAMRAGAHDFITKSNLARLAPAVRREVRAARERQRSRGGEDRAQRDSALVGLGRWEWFVPLAFAISLTLVVGLCVNSLIEWLWPHLPLLSSGLLMLGTAGPVVAVSLHYLLSHRRALMQRMISDFVEKRRLKEMQRRLADRTRELENTLTERQRHEEHLKAQHALTRIMAGSDPMDQAFSELLRCFCITLRWEVGEYWAVNPADAGVSLATAYWAPPLARDGADRPQLFLSLVLRTLAQARPLWVPDIRTEIAPGNPLRNCDPPMRAALAFPIRLGRDILGVMVFATSHLRETDAELLELLEDIGNQIGQFSERRRALDELRRTHEELEMRVARRTAELASLNEALSRSESNLRQAQQIARLGSFEIQFPCEGSTGNYWSEEALRIAGVDVVRTDLSMSEFVGRWVHPNDRARIVAELERLQATGHPSECEYRVVRPDGAVRFVRMSAETSRDVDGAVVGLVGTLHDLTERRELERQLLEISENEQRRIGQDLHDDLCQHLAGIEFMSQALQERLRLEGHEEEGLARQVGDLVRGAINQTRGLARGLSPVQVESLGLIAALEDLAAHIHQIFQVRCEVDVDASVDVRDLPSATHLYRITQEAINNAIRHGKADHVRIELKRISDLARLRIVDNGRGFSGAAEVRSRSGGLGLRIMNYRAGMVGGSLHVGPAPGGGVQVECLFRLDL